MSLFKRFTKTKEDVPESNTGSADDAAGSGAGQGDAARAAAGDSGSKPKKGGLFARFRAGLKRTSDILNTDIRDLFKQEGQLVDDDFLDRLFALLVRTDMGVNPAREIQEQIKKDFRGRKAEMDEVLTAVKAKLLELMAQDQQPLEVNHQPTVVLVVGVNGSGKTTSIAKLTKMLIDRGYKTVLGAGDTFRAAAVEQLSVWADRLGAEIVKGDQGVDPASIAHRAVAKAIETNADVCVIDTAGRLQTQTNLMQELSKIRRVIEKQIDTAPHEVLLVLDATAGQNGLSQAKGFADAVDCTGIVLAKLDGTAKGGVVIPIRQQFEIPVRYIGVGESPEDLALFDPAQFIDALFSTD
ncbi:MAG: signal recognition particle-docking protein FtsY [Planctomycetales bacterium]|nr:signal recognition particle-docking protein FtsY [Planctomycetales bacterium]